MASADEIVGIGADLEPETLLAAYRAGIFPMPIEDASGVATLAWWAPDPRAIVDIDAHRCNRSMVRARRSYEIRVDTAFDAVTRGCADPARPHGWITDEIIAAYSALHTRGDAHSVEAWRDGTLCGGLYGVEVGGLFCAESMYHVTTGASTAAVAGCIEILRAAGPGRVMDVQWITDHLAHLGVIEVSRKRYTALVEALVALPGAAWRMG